MLPLTADRKIHWNHTARARKSLAGEAHALGALISAWQETGAKRVATVTGGLTHSGKGYTLYVRRAI